MKIILFALDRRQAQEFLRRPEVNVMCYMPGGQEWRLLGLVRETAFHVLPGYPETDQGLRIARARFQYVSEAEFRAALQQMETRG